MPKYIFASIGHIVEKSEKGIGGVDIAYWRGHLYFDHGVQKLPLICYNWNLLKFKKKNFL